MIKEHHSHPARRRGAVYVIVLGVAMIVSILGLCGLQLARIQLQGVQATNDRQEARILALSAVDHAVSMMHYNSNWRTDYQNDVEVGPWSLGDNSFRWKLVDEDGDLADDASDPVWVYGIGQVDDAVWVSRARARIDGGLPLEFLRTAIHSAGRLNVTGPGSTALTVIGAPASTDGNLNNDRVINGDVEAVNLTGAGTITGTTTVPAERKGVPPRSLFDDYVARATPLPFIGNVNKMVLAPGVNEYGGGLNADGVYYIDASSGDIVIKNSRIHGTLIIETGNNKAKIQDQCFIEPYRDDFPCLIIKGNVELKLKSNAGSGSLSESAEGHNFNPTGAPYGGQTDSDLSDLYPCEIHGLVHVIGPTTFKETILIRGCVVVDGTATVEKQPQIIHDPNLMYNPPLGYTENPGSTDMIIKSRSWTCQPAP